MAASRSNSGFPRRSAVAGLSSLRAAIVLLTLCLSEVHGLEAAAQPPSEYQVKAAFLLNFTKFIDWPESSFSSPDTPISICILGDDPFGAGLDRIVEGETVNSRRITIQRVHRLPLPGCHVLFIGQDEKDIPRTVAGLRPGILTVGEGERFLRQGGMIAFVIDSRRVRFDVNQPAAANAGLQISSKLLSVARNVEK